MGPNSAIGSDKLTTMEAIKISIGFREWSKLPDFVEMINAEAEMFAYEVRHI